LNWPFDVVGDYFKPYVDGVNKHLQSPQRMPKIKAPTPDRYHHGDLRAALLQAALELADRQGPSALSTRELARLLGVSHAAPARHFPSHAALVAEVAASAFEMFGKALTRAASGTSGKERLIRTGHAYVRFALKHPGLLRLMFSHEPAELEVPSERLSKAGDAAYAALVDAVSDALGERAEPERVARASFMAWSIVHGAVNLWLDGPMARKLRDRGGERAFLALADAAVENMSRALSFI
jgi:AcrR family transcriptional regulator